MKNSIAFIILFLLLSCNSNEKKKQFPIIELGRKEINIDTLKIGDTLRTDFKVHNKGNADLIIEQIESSCGCTITSLKDSIISPRDYTMVELMIIPNDTGKFERKVVIKSNTKKIFHILAIEGFVTEN